MTPIERHAVERAYRSGHFWSPDAINAAGGVLTLADLRKVRIDDAVTIAALRSMSQSEAVVYAAAVEQAHGRAPDFDGVVGPAMTALTKTPRCHVPDIAPPPGTQFAFDDPAVHGVAVVMQQDAMKQATGSGNWANCHGVGDYHSAVVRVQTGGVPSFLRPVFSDVLKRVQKAYAGIGLLFRFIDEGRDDIFTRKQWEGPVNIEFSFVGSSSGWIGLAIVGNGQGCASNIWCRYLATYRGGSSQQSIAQQWTTLIKHELGHNCGLDHSRGGVMNPSIVNGLAPEWSANDPSTSILKRWYGGEPVPMDEPKPEPPKPPTPPEPDRIAELETRADKAEAALLAQQGINAWLMDRLDALEADR